MIKRKHKFILVGPLPPPITGVSLANKIILENLPKYFPKYKVDFINTSYPTFKEDIGKFSLKKVFVYTKQYKELYKIFKSDKVYITTGQTFFGVLKYAPYILLSKFLNKELIIHIHGDFLWQEYNKLSGYKKKLLKYLISKFDKGIVLSKSLRRNLEPFIPEDKIFELPNFVEDYLFDMDIEKKLKENFNELRIIYLSNLMKEKGILDLFEALLILKEKNIPFKVKIAGNVDSSLQDEIFGYLEKLKENVEYLGVVLGNQKKEILKWGNVFVLPSYNEGQPISILEAYATGNIVLTTNQGGIPDIFKENINGFHIEKQNPESIANKLCILSSNLKDYKSIALNNYNEAFKRYRVEIFIKNFTNILEN